MLKVSRGFHSSCQNFGVFPCGAFVLKGFSPKSVLVPPRIDVKKLKFRNIAHIVCKTMCYNSILKKYGNTYIKV